MFGAIFFFASCACGTVLSPAPFFGLHCLAPAGLVVSSHSYSNRCLRKSWLHFVGVVVQVTSRPLVMASPARPDPNVLVQPMPIASRPAPSGSGPTLSGTPAPCAL